MSGLHALFRMLNSDICHLYNYPSKNVGSPSDNCGFPTAYCRGIVVHFHSAIYGNIISFVLHYSGSSPPLPRRGLLPSASPLPPPPPPPANVAAHHLLPPPSQAAINASTASHSSAATTNNTATSATAAPQATPAQPQQSPFQRRFAPDYSVAAQMAAQISHARHVRQMNNAAAMARRTSLQTQLSSSPSQVSFS